MSKPHSQMGPKSRRRKGRYEEDQKRAHSVSAVEPDSSLWSMLKRFLGTGSYTPPLLEETIATDTLTSSPAPVVYKISGLVGGGFLYVTGVEAENSAVNFLKRISTTTVKNQSPRFCWARAMRSPKQLEPPLPGSCRKCSSLAWKARCGLTKDKLAGVL